MVEGKLAFQGLKKSTFEDAAMIHNFSACKLTMPLSAKVHWPQNILLVANLMMAKNYSQDDQQLR